MSNQSKKDLSILADNNGVKTIDRRGLLKKMLIAGGVVATSQLIPSEWIKPVIDVGTLPAHAQGSIAGPVPLTSETIIGHWAISANDNGEVISDTIVLNAGGTGLVEGLGAITWVLAGTILTLGGSVDNFGPVSGNSNAFTMIDQDGIVFSLTRVG